MRPEGYPIVWYSPDGREWARSGITKTIRPCPGWVARTDGEITQMGMTRQRGCPGRAHRLAGAGPLIEVPFRLRLQMLGRTSPSLPTGRTVSTLADQRRVLLRHQHRLQLEAINMAGAAGAARLDCPSGGRST